MSEEVERLVERYMLAEYAGNEGVWDWETRSGKFYGSGRFSLLVGLGGEGCVLDANAWLDRVHPEDRPWLEACFSCQWGVKMPPFLLEHRVRDAAGGWRWLLCRGVAVQADGAGDGDGQAECGEEGPQRLVGSVLDIHERKVMEQALRASEERYALAARGANDGLWDWRLDSGETYFSGRCMAMLGHESLALENRPGAWLRHILPEDRLGLKTAVRDHLRGRSGHIAHEFRLTRRDGNALWCLIRGMSVLGGEGHPVRVAGSLTDITARKKAELRLQFNALHDSLTGLPNRLLLLDRIGRALTRLRSGGAHFAVLFLDIDRFKTVNDSLGNAVGDLVLTTTAARLLRVRRDTDTLARLSADEFALLVEGVEDPADAMEEAERLRAAVARPFRLESREIVFTASVGIAHSATGYQRAEEMLRDASLAMVRAKSGGRSRAEVFDSRLRETALQQLRTEAELRLALEEHQFELYYQPIVELETHRIAGVEALIRWNHPERGLVPPVDFIGLAEESGLIVPIGRWALEEAARQLVVWQKEYGARAPEFSCVNVSTRQFRDDDLLGVVGQVLERTGVAPASLKLEITESLLMNTDNCEPVMRAIEGLGVRFSIDDFGTGYSSLSYLHRLPASTLKIDRSFITLIREGPDKAAIVQVITALAAMLDMDVVAEGIEQEEEEAFLRSVRCRYGQGFLYSRPVPAAALERKLQENGL